jgi:hypothetical protein
MTTGRVRFWNADRGYASSPPIPAAMIYLCTSHASRMASTRYAKGNVFSSRNARAGASRAPTRRARFLVDLKPVIVFRLAPTR